MITSQFIATVSKIHAIAIQAALIGAELLVETTVHSSPDDAKNCTISGKIVMDPRMKGFVNQTLQAHGVVPMFE